MSRLRIEVNRAGLREVLKSPGVRAELERRAHAIAAAADAAANDPGGHRVETEVGADRARAAVITVTPKAMYKEATQRTLSRSLGAGR